MVNLSQFASLQVETASLWPLKAKSISVKPERGEADIPSAFHIFEGYWMYI